MCGSNVEYGIIIIIIIIIIYTTFEFIQGENLAPLKLMYHEPLYPKTVVFVIDHSILRRWCWGYLLFLWPFDCSLPIFVMFCHVYVLIVVFSGSCLIL